jgi:flagellin
MPIIINNNVASLIAQRNLGTNSSSLTQSIERLSSGYRINKASDDAAGLSISENLRSQIRGNAKAMGNTQDGMNMLTIAEGGLSVVGENIQRIRELCVQAANETNGTTERSAILSEITARLADINRIARATQFNNLSLLDGSLSSCRLQIGAGAASVNVIDISSVMSKSTAATALGLNLSVSASTWSGDNIRSYLSSIDDALKTLNSRRSDLGAFQNRLQSSLENLTVMNENLQASESRIRDLDVAAESATMTKYQILQQASATVLAQANQIPQIALTLIR